MVMIKCSHCGKLFNTHDPEERTFCSEECDTNWYRQNVAGYEDYEANWYNMF